MSQPPQFYDGMIFGATSGGDTGFPCEVFALNAKHGQGAVEVRPDPEQAG